MVNKIPYYVQLQLLWQILMKLIDQILKVQKHRYLTMMMLRNIQIMMMVVLTNKIMEVISINKTKVVNTMMYLMTIIMVIIRTNTMYRMHLKMILMIFGIIQKLKMLISILVLNKQMDLNHNHLLKFKHLMYKMFQEEV